MNRLVWNIKKRLGVFYNIMIKRVRSIYFPITVGSLKSAEYRELPAPIDWEKITKGRDLRVEIGSGHGEVLLGNDKEKSIIVGYETKTRFFKLSFRKTWKRSDIFLYQGNGYESFLLHYADFSVSELLILFPDPWHKKKHNKRRPIIESFFRNATQKLKSHGRIVVATDWPEYAKFITEQVLAVKDVYEVEIKPYKPVEFGLPITHFHQKWVRQGRSFTAFVLKKLV